MVLPDSTRISRVPAYSGRNPRPPPAFRLRGSHPLWPGFPTGSASADARPKDRQAPPGHASYPAKATAAAFSAPAVWTPPRSLAATGGITRLFPLPRGTEMFQFPRFASHGLCIQPQDDRASPRPGCPIRTSADLRLRAAPRGFSQLATSFIAGPYLGIHRAPSLA